MTEDTGFDKAMRGEPVAVTDARLKEMQAQAKHMARTNFYEAGHLHWHWLAALNELASLRAASQPPDATRLAEAEKFVRIVYEQMERNGKLISGVQLKAMAEKILNTTVQQPEAPAS